MKRSEVERWRRAAAAVLCAAALLAGGCARETEAGVVDVPAADVLALVDAPGGPLLLDVRTPQEFASGRVPGAVNIPIAELPGRLGELADAREDGLVVYCERGPRAHRASEVLVAAGFPDVRHLDGDMAAWRSAGLPVEK